jgi:hypothetical protein
MIKYYNSAKKSNNDYSIIRWLNYISKDIKEVKESIKSIKDTLKADVTHQEECS